MREAVTSREKRSKINRCFDCALSRMADRAPLRMTIWDKVEYETKVSPTYTQNVQYRNGLGTRLTTLEGVDQTKG